MKSNEQGVHRCGMICHANGETAGELCQASLVCHQLEFPVSSHRPTLYEQVLGVKILGPFLLLFSLLMMFATHVLSTEFPFARSVSLVGTDALCRLGSVEEVDAASYQTASFRAEVST